MNLDNIETEEQRRERGRQLEIDSRKIAVGLSKRERRPDVVKDFIPTPEEIAEETEKIRSGWSKSTFRTRSVGSEDHDPYTIPSVHDPFHGTLSHRSEE